MEFYGNYLTQIVLGLVASIVMLVSMWKIYEKADKPGWACIVPVYNYICFMRIAGKPLWWFFLFFIPIVNVVIGIRLIVNFIKNFGLPGWHAWLFIFFPYAYLPYMAFSHVQYEGPEL